jgi:hypothetical protein
MDVEDRHSIYVMANGYTQEEVETYMDGWVSSPAVQKALSDHRASDDYVLSLATNYEGEFLGYGYMYCLSPELYHVMLGRQPTGLHGVLVPGAPPVPYIHRPQKWGTPSPRFNWADDTDLHLPPKRLVPKNALVTTEGTFIQLKPAHIAVANQTRYLRGWSVPPEYTAESLWHLAHIYTTHLEVLLCKDRREVILVFPEMTYDANFAAFFLRKVVLTPTTALVFRPLFPDEHPPMYKNLERYVPE